MPILMSVSDFCKIIPNGRKNYT